MTSADQCEYISDGWKRYTLTQSVYAFSGYDFFVYFQSARDFFGRPYAIFPFPAFKPAYSQSTQSVLSYHQVNVSNDMKKKSIVQVARDYGQKWAWNMATPNQLQSLETFAEPLFGNGPFDAQPSPWGHADEIAASALGVPMSQEATHRF